MNIYQYIIAFALILIASHLFNIISARSRIPTVLFLVFSGYLIKLFLFNRGHTQDLPFSLLQILGTVGLVMIVLEGTMDLQLRKEKAGLIKKAFILSLTSLVVSSVSISCVIAFFTKAPLVNALLYAVPLSIISSALVIPSVDGLSDQKKEFMIYESTFSDIIGILIFNFFAFEEVTSVKAIPEFTLSILVMGVISIAASVLLIFILAKTRSRTKIVMILSVLLLIYSFGKMYHLSALILILVFGLTLNNFDTLFTYFKLRQSFKRFFVTTHTISALKEMKLINSELSFIIRTMFFIAFGYSIELEGTTDHKVLFSGLIILCIIYLLRFLNLKVFIKAKMFPEIFIAPRGLITILLYYIIPKKYQIPNFEDNLLFLIIIATSILMMIGLVLYKKPVEVINQDDF